MTLPEIEFATSRRIVFGAGAFERAAEIACGLGTSAFIVTGRSALAEPHPAPLAEPGTTGTPERQEPRPRGSARLRFIAGAADQRGASARQVSPAKRRGPIPCAERSPLGILLAGLAERRLSAVHYIVHGEPTTMIADEGARAAIAAGCDLVIGLGGGSVLDAAKAISGLITNGGVARDYIEIAGEGRALESPAAPLLAVPTTAGTGSEVTRNAVLIEPRARVKVSMRSPLLLPAAALVDPDLTLSMSPFLTATTGLDALTQLIEAYVTPRATPTTDLFALDGIARSARSLLRAVADGADRAAREELSLASLYGGIALANAGLGAVHGIAAALGGRRPVPHGAACALLLPHVFVANLDALRAQTPRSSPSLERMSRVGEILVRCALFPGENGPAGAPFAGSSRTGAALPRGADPAVAGAQVLRKIVATCELPGLASYGVRPEDIPAIVEGALRASSMKGNPVPLPPETLAAIIAAAL